MMTCAVMFFFELGQNVLYLIFLFYGICDLAIAPILGERAANADHIGMQQPQQKVIQMSNVPTQPAAAPIGK